MRRVIGLAVLILVGAACGPVTDPVAASIGDREITFERIDRGLEEFRRSAQYETLAAQGDVAAIERDFQQGLLAQLVRRAVLTPHARELGIEISDEQVQEQLDAIQADFPSTSAFEEALKEQGLDVPTLRELVGDRLLEEAVRDEVTAEVGPTDEEVAAYYEDNIDDYRQVEVWHILVNRSNRADRIADRLRSVPADQLKSTFERLARRFSLDEGSAASGGYLGFTQPEQFVDEFAEAVRTLEVGEISDPVQTEFGHHVVHVSARRTLSFEEVESQIAQTLGGPIRDEAFNEWLIEAYSDVRVSSRFGELDPVTGAIADPSADDVPGAEAPPLEEPTPGEPPGTR